jgi:hypothetical protein
MTARVAASLIYLCRIGEHRIFNPWCLLQCWAAE